jgi:DNA polymerase-3 subunit gamma/tau
VFIVDEAQMLSRHAWNSLLKTLEEPPPHVLFIFATTEPHKVIETVRSRCQRFDFRRITAADIAAKLRRIAAAESVEVEEGVYEEIAVRATGGLRDAESLFDQALSAAPTDRPLAVDDLVAILGGIPRQARRRLLELARAGEMPAVLEEAAGLVDGGADPAELLRDLYGDLRDAAVAAACGREEELGVEWCLAAAEIVGRHQRMAADSRALRATLDLALLALARLGDVADLERLAERLEGLASGEPGAPAPEPAPPRQGGVDVRSELRDKLQRRAPETGSLEKGPAPQENARPGPARSQAPSSEELARIRGNPRVREVLKTFGGQFEHVRNARRTQDG